MIDTSSLFLLKARESLAGAESEFANGRYSNSANRSYYATFQAAIAALLRAGTQPPGGDNEWGHAFVAPQFDTLINRRKLYPSELRGVIGRNRDVRRRADYTRDAVTATEANRALRRARRLVTAAQT